MQYHTDDVRITGMEEVVAPDALIQELPLPAAGSRLVFEQRRAVADIVHGRDPRLLVIVGPCSIHDPASALEYADRLAEQAKHYSKQLLIVMRVYFEKPRTTVGWKGLINDPDLDNSFAINRGLRTARKLLVDITAKGLPAGTEYLDPITPQYIADLICWGAIGARTTESQVHRQLASGLSCPVGFKNSTDGSIQVASDAVRSAMHPHIFLSVAKAGHSAIFSTAGNGDCHLILRGGGGKTNYDQESVAAASALQRAADVNPRVMVDASHANSSKDHMRQLDVIADLSAQLRNSDCPIMGAMIESHLVAGRQDIAAEPLTYGQSITDACLGWDDTVRGLEQLADAMSQR